VPTGFSTDHISVVTLESTDDRYHAPFLEAVDLTESLRGAPGVEASGLSDSLTFNDGWIGYGMTVPAEPNLPERQVHLLKVDGGYFGALRIPLLAGRTFTGRDDEHAPKVVILSDGTARRLFRGENPIGRRILLGRFRNPRPEDEMEIVGVVNDIKFGSVTAPGPDLVLQPLLQGQHNIANTSSLRLQVRSRMSPAQVAALARSRIAALGLRVNVATAAALDDAVSASMLDHRIRMQASGLFGALALLLLTAGMNGLMGYLVVLRRRELGIRVAVGSRPSGIVGLVLRDSLGLVLAGFVVGLPGALAVMKAVSHMVFGLHAFDWASVAMAALVLFLTAVLASAMPAWRAARLDPVEVLRPQ
jgi:ABC-type antimicrobial peptide transport system permease subunit